MTAATIGESRSGLGDLVATVADAGADRDDRVARLLAGLKRKYVGRITGELTMPALAAHSLDLPAEMHPALRQALAARGLERLYSHQRGGLGPGAAGRHLVVATPTASGKTLCYNLPVLDAVLSRGAKALYLFPTKALAQDQVAELSELNRWGARAHGRSGPGRQGIHLRRRHPRRCAQGGAHPRRHRGVQPGHAAPGDPAASHEVGAVLRVPGLHRRRRAAQLPRRLRLPCGQRLPPPDAHLPILWRRAALHLRVRHHRQSGRAGAETDRRAGGGDHRERRATRGAPSAAVEPAGDQPGSGHPRLGPLPDHAHRPGGHKARVSRTSSSPTRG